MLDIEWSYAIAPLAHIVLLAVPPAETLGVQGFPNLFNAISSEIDAAPAGTVFSDELRRHRADLRWRGAAADREIRHGVQEGDCQGRHLLRHVRRLRLDRRKQHAETTTYPYPTDWWPASSPYVTSAGAAQLQYGWTCNPTSDTPFLADGSLNPAYFAYTSGGT